MFPTNLKKTNLVQNCVHNFASNNNLGTGEAEKGKQPETTKNVTFDGVAAPLVAVG
jgi:hypothetical protein